jgi:hypothetical protein
MTSTCRPVSASSLSSSTWTRQWLDAVGIGAEREALALVVDGAGDDQRNHGGAWIALELDEPAPAVLAAQDQVEDDRTRLDAR